MQGREVDRLILYRIPKGGIPEEGIEEGTVIAARVPIYGTKDAGRGFWLRLKEVVTEQGCVLNMILPTMFTLREKGKIVSALSSNVDDLLYGSLPGYEKAIQKILDTFDVKVQNEGEFRFCGKEFKQNSDYSITVTAKDNTEKIRPIDIPKKKRLVDKYSDVEITALRSVVASIAWIARQVRTRLIVSSVKIAKHYKQSMHKRSKGSQQIA